MSPCFSLKGSPFFLPSRPFQTTPFLVSILCLKQPVSFIPYSSLGSNLIAFRWFLFCAVSLLFIEGLTLFSTISPVSDPTIPCFESLFEATCLFHSLLISPIQYLCIRLVSGTRHCCCCWFGWSCKSFISLRLLQSLLPHGWSLHALSRYGTHLAGCCIAQTDA